MANLRRYARNMERGGISLDVQEKLITSKVLVMGAGGLGSGVIMNLAAFGVGQIKIIDDDIVEEGNLNSQFIHKYKNIGRAKVMSAKDWIQDFNPDIKVELDKIKLNELNYFNVIQGYDIIVDCFDSYESKYMLNEIALRHKKILIHGGIQASCGQVTTIVPDKTGCLACVLQKPKTFVEEKYATFSPIVNTISALQSQEVLKVLTGMGEPLLNKLLIFDGMNSSFKTMEYSKNMLCEECGENRF
ncbi:MAG: HesA/MoeB/ThiF family protein [Candidatus Gastranaerophilales bacterium]|nr:HesA/MoeB/ThiF family protein [Candidatus Gastranaerophilales bacterium]